MPNFREITSFAVKNFWAGVGLIILGSIALAMWSVILTLMVPLMVGFAIYASFKLIFRGEVPQVPQGLLTPVKGVYYSLKKMVFPSIRSVWASIGGVIALLAMPFVKVAGFVYASVRHLLGGGWVMAKEGLGGGILGAALGIVLVSTMPGLLQAMPEEAIVAIGGAGGVALGVLNGLSVYIAQRRADNFRRLMLKQVTVKA